MKYSSDGLHLTENFEALRLTAYKDRCAYRFNRVHVCKQACPGVWTIGYGHTLQVHEGMAVDQAEAERLLRIDLLIAEQSVDNLVAVPVTQGEFDALVDFALNAGGHALATSTLLKKLNAGDYDGACDEFDRWVFDNKVKVTGLQRRRDAEQDIFDPEHQYHTNEAKG